MRVLAVFRSFRGSFGWILVVAAMLVVTPRAHGQASSKNIAIARDHARQKWAVLVGVNRYNELKSLVYCHEDVQELSRRLVRAGFPAANVTLLTSDAKEPKYQPFKVNIERQLELVTAMAGEEDLLVVAFSGHGTHSDGASYLCPAEARVEDPKGTMVPLDLVYNRLAQCKARWKLLVVDACRNDPRPSGMKDAKAYEKSAGDFAKSLEKPPQGILALTSCAPGEVSMEADELHHGVFMNFFLEGLSGKADRDEGNGNGQVSLLELYRYTNIQTKRYVTRQFNRGQTPTLRGEIPEDYEISAASADPAVLAAMAQGDEHFKKNRHEEAIVAYARAIQLDPKHIPAYDGRGRSRWCRTEYPAAILDHTLAIQLGPQAVSLARRSRVYLSSSDLDRALADADEAIRLDQSCAEAHRARGRVLAKKGLAAAALAECNEAIRLDPAEGKAYYDRGAVYTSAKRYDQALTDMNEAVRLDPENAAAHFGRGIVHGTTGRNSQAVVEYTEAIRLDPRYACAYVNRGNMLEQMGQVVQAMADFNEAIRLDPKVAMGYYNRGNIHRNANRNDQALADFSESIRLDPKYAPAYVNRGVLHTDANRKDQAMADFNEAIRLDPQLGRAYHTRGYLYQNAGQPDQALADYNEAIRLDPKYAWTYNNRGLLRYERKQLAEAIEDFNTAVSLGLNSSFPFTNRGKVYLEYRQYDWALADFNEAIRRDPKFKLAYQLRALVYRVKGMIAEAQADERKANELQ